MATRAIKPKREDTLLSGWQPLPERAPSIVRPDQPLVARIVALFSLALVLSGFLAMVASPEGMLRGMAAIGAGWGTMFFTLGLGGLLYHAFRDGEKQYRVLYTLAGLALLLLGGLFLLLPDRHHFVSKGAPILGLALLFLLAVVRQETDAKPRMLILRLLGLIGGFFTLVGFVGCTASNVFLMDKDGLAWLILGLPYLCAYISQEDAGSERGHLAGLGMGLVGGIALVIALVRSLWPILTGVRAGSEAYLVPQGFWLISFGLVYVLVAISICSDWTIVVLTRRELAAFFYSPVAYLVTLGIMGVGFVMFVDFLNILGRGLWEPIVRALFFNFYPVVCVMFLVPALTMRLLSEESRTGTLEVLLTAPVNEMPIVLSKFFAALVFYLVALSPWMLYLLALRWMGGKAYDYRPLLTFFLALVCSGAGFLSVGLFFSSLSRNQIIAAVLTFVAMIAFTSLYIIGGRQMMPSPWNEIFSYASYLDLWWSSLDGLFVPRNLLFHLSLTAFFLYLTTKVLEARKWN